MKMYTHTGKHVRRTYRERDLVAPHPWKAQEPSGQRNQRIDLPPHFATASLSVAMDEQKERTEGGENGQPNQFQSDGRFAE